MQKSMFYCKSIRATGQRVSPQIGDSVVSHVAHFRAQFYCFADGSLHADMVEKAAGDRAQVGAI